MNDFKWPKDGFVCVLAEGGKFWAATVDPHFLKEIGDKPDDQIFAQYFQPAIHHLKQMAAESRKKAITEICKKQVNRKFAVQ